MTDIGQKFALGPRRRLRRLLGLLQRLGSPFLIVNIGEGAEPADDTTGAALADLLANDTYAESSRQCFSAPGMAIAVFGMCSGWR